jgi:hypothetical protein
MPNAKFFIDPTLASAAGPYYNLYPGRADAVGLAPARRQAGLPEIAEPRRVAGGDRGRRFA